MAKTQVQTLPTQIKRTPVKLSKDTKPPLIIEPATPVITEMGDVAPPQLKITQELLNIVKGFNLTSQDLDAIQKISLPFWIMSSNIEVDHHPFDFNKHRYLLPLYFDNSKKIVLMKSAQMGATVWMILKLLWFCLFNNVKACLFFPTKEAAGNLSKDRLSPMIRSCPALSEAVSDTDSIGYKRIGAKSSLYIQHMGGEASKDSTPFDLICFDEVRLLSLADIDQARERISHSSYKYEVQVSTAGLLGCFSGDTKLIVRQAENRRSFSMSFLELFEKDAWRDYEVLSYDRRKRGSVTWKPILGIVNQGRKDTVCVVLETGKAIVCTPDHKFATTHETELGASVHFSPVNRLEQTLVLKDLLDITETKSHFYETTPFNELTAIRILSVRENIPQDVFDIQVEETPWFFLAESGCLVHNSDIHKSFVEGTQNYWHTNCNCFPIDTDVWVVEGSKLVKHSLRDLKDTWVGKRVLSWSERTHSWARSKVVGYYEGGKQQTLVISFKDKTNIQVTYDHIFYSQENSEDLNFLPIRAVDIVPGTKLVVLPKMNGYFVPELVGCPFIETKAVMSIIPGPCLDVACLTVNRNHNFLLAETGLLVHNCSDGVVLSDHWPEVAVVTKHEVYWRCPVCKMRIVDPQNGRYIAHNPGAGYPSYHVSQLLSEFISPAEIWTAWQKTNNIKEFYNAKLGMPYISKEAQPLKYDDLLACENSNILWGKTKHRLEHKIRTAMGVDQMSGVNYVVIAELHEDKKRIIHYEIIDDKNPIYHSQNKSIDQRFIGFKRLYQLIEEFDVDLCVIDAMPNINEATEFAMAFPKRVFVAHYIDTHRDMVTWGDRARYKIGVRKGGHKNQIQV